MTPSTGDKIIADETRAESNNSRYESSTSVLSRFLSGIYLFHVRLSHDGVVDHSKKCINDGMKEAKKIVMNAWYSVVVRNSFFADFRYVRTVSLCLFERFSATGQNLELMEEKMT